MSIYVQGKKKEKISQEIAEHVVLRYMQRWGKDMLRHRLDWQMTEDGVATHPRHLRSTYCPCQYVEEILIAKIPKPTVKSKMSSIGFSV